MVLQAPRHPEVNQENPSSFETNNQILPAPLECLDRLPFELGRDLPWLVWARQTRVCDLDSLEGASDEHRLEPGSDRLDLWQLRHARSVTMRLAC